MRQIFFVLAVLALAVTAEDFEWSSGGSMGTVPTLGGSNDWWGEWFITSVQNNSGQDLILTQIAFPCCGDASDSYGWVVWTDVGGLVAPSGDVTTCDFHGPYTPADPGPTSPPTTYTYVDVSSFSITIPSGNFFCFGYDNTLTGGQIDFNGVDTWAWYDSAWDPDQSWSRTAVIEVYANFFTALERSTWGEIKTMF